MLPINYDYNRLRYLNLPAVPEEIINRLSFNFDEYESRLTLSNGNFVRSKSFNEEIDTWCRKNVCDVGWGFQIIKGNLNIHVDQTIKTKLIYIIETGGDNVLTNFFDEHGNITFTYCIEPRRWHLLKVDVPHNVINVEPGKTRFSLVSTIFN